MRTTCNTCSREWSGFRAAHCSGCHITFTTPLAFDRHQSLRKGAVTCSDPSSVGLVYVEWRDAYRFMTPDEEKDSMVCDPCKDGRHCMSDKCTCQHKPAAQALGVAGIDSGEAVGDIGGA